MTTPLEIDIGAAAAEVRAAQDSMRPLPTLTSRHQGFQPDLAYRVAAGMHALRAADGDVPVGRKIGFTNATVQRQYSVHEPIWGHVYRRTLVGLDGPATFDIGHLSAPRLEPEIVVHFRAPPPVGGDPDAILATIDWIAHGFEIVQSNFPDWKFEAADAIAANGLHGALLMGPPQPVERLGSNVVEALERFSLILSCDGQLRDSGSGSNVLGNPLRAVAHLTHVLAAQGDAIKADEIITTGTITGAFLIKRGETWTTEITGIALPGLTVRFV